MKAKHLLAIAIVVAAIKVGYDLLERLPPVALSPAPKASTPEETVASFMEALRSRSAGRMERCWLPHRGSFFVMRDGSFALSNDTATYQLSTDQVYTIVGTRIYPDADAIQRRAPPTSWMAVSEGVPLVPGDLEVTLRTTAGNDARLERLVLRRVGDAWRVAEWAVGVGDR